MPAAEIQVTIVGNGTTVVFNDYSSGTPSYVLRNTAELLTSLSTRQTKSPKQSGHGIDDSLSQDEDRVLTFEGQVIGSSQSDRKTKQDALSRCVALPTLQNYATNDGYVLLQFTDEDGTLKQCYAKIVSYPTFHVIDNTDPTLRGFDFVMMAKDPNLYGQTLNTQTGPEEVSGTNFQIVTSSSPTMPFQLYSSIPVVATCTNAGNVDAPTILVVDGPSASPKILNETTGVFMNLNKAGGLTLLSGERVEIDFNARSITKYDASAVASDVSGNLSDDSEWLLLQPGSNSLTLTDASPDTIVATLTVQWRDTYK